MNAKHQFKYTFNETYMEEFSPVDITMEVPGEVTLTQMLYNFERYLQACGFVFDGKLDFVEEEYDLKDEEPIWPDDYDGYENEPEGGCMADFDKECGCSSTSSSLESNDGKWNKAEKMVKDFNDAYDKLTHEQKMKAFKEACTMSDLHYEATKEVAKNKWVHGICNPPSPDWKAQNKNK